MNSPSVLAINAGSATIRFAAIEAETGKRWLFGEADKLGSSQAVFACGADGAEPEERPIPKEIGQLEAIELIRVAAFDAAATGKRELRAVAHRVVHGGPTFVAPVEIDEGVLKTIEELIPLAPQHNPVALKQIQFSQRLFPDQRHFACFDTSFHATIPRRAFLYALPPEYYERHGIRRFGFHGFSHQRVAAEMPELLGKPLRDTAIISVHLGNGCSVNATEAGVSLDNSMGLTPLEGIAMGSRSGDVDPGLIFYLVRDLGMDIDAVETLLSKESGLLGLSGISNDMRELRAPELLADPRVDLAMEIFCYRIAKAIAAARVALQDLDAIVFTGGIGASDSITRASVAGLIRFLGCELDPTANAKNGAATRGRISLPDTRPALFALPVNEEAAMVDACSVLL